MTTTFKDLGLTDKTLIALQKKGFEEPTLIQQKVIPVILSSDKDVVGQSRTGSGKTAAFGLPLLELLNEGKKHVQALILVPTRELAIQVSEEIHSLKSSKSLSVTPIYGGQAISLQLRKLERGVDIVVGTPGRIMDHLERKTLNLEHVSFLVLDEADEMLSMGFLDDVRTIMKACSPARRTMLFSATLPQEIMSIVKKYMNDYDLIKAESNATSDGQIDQIYFEVSNSNKFEALCRIIDVEEDFYGLIFCRTKMDVKNLAHQLIETGYDVDALSGDVSQSERERILKKFKNRVINIMVATDVAARGIDVQNLTHVINYALPQDPQSYIHRIGRTGRAGKSGHAITLITPSESRRMRLLGKQANADIRKGKLPHISDIINIKKQKIKTDINEILQKEAHTKYLPMAEDILGDQDPKAVMASMLHHFFQDSLDEKSYRVSEEREPIVDTQGKTRLFVTHGKADGLTAKKLAAYITETCGISNDKINDIQICETFSFVTLPFHEAEVVLDAFQRGSGNLFLIEKARPRSTSSGPSQRSSGGYSRSSDRDRGNRDDRGDRGRYKKDSSRGR